MAEGRDPLLVWLRAAVERAGNPPAHVLAAGRAALATVALDAELAALAWDSEADLTVRSAAPDAVHGLAFEHPAVSVELEIGAPGPQRHLVGQVTAGAAVAVVLERPGRDGLPVAVGPDGRFEVAGISRGPLRLELLPEGGPRVLTPWVRVG